MTVSAPELAPQRRDSVVAKTVRRGDPILLLATLALAVIGVVMVYSASRQGMLAAGLDPSYYLKRQALWVGIGVVALIVTSVVDYHRLERLAPLAYLGVIFALLAVMSPVGSAAKGSQRWISLGGFQLQPSAFAILAMVIFWPATSPVVTVTSVLAGTLLLAGIPMVFVAAQPDLGSSIIIATVVVAVVSVAGIRGRYLVALAALAVVGTLVMFNSGLMKQYQKDRLTSFLEPVNATTVKGSGYNLEQSTLAISHGGLAGTGLFKGSLTNLAYVPEQRTDFIFSAVGEQLGFVGSAGVVALFAVVAWRVGRAAQLARDRFGLLLAVGVLAVITISVFINVGMTMGIMPITGIPLPFLSYGGSAVITLFAAVGIVQSIIVHQLR